MKPLRICIFSLYTYPLFNQAKGQLFGGAEVRSWVLAKGLARRPAVEVSMVVFDHGQPDDEVRDGVRLIKWRGWPPSPLVSQKDWLLWLARHLATRPFVRPPLTIQGHNVHWRQLKSFERADADVYCAFGVSNVSAELAAYCKAVGKPFVLFASSDYNFSEIYYDGSTETDVYGTSGALGYYAIANADLIFAQTARQAKLCREEFERDAEVVTNPVDLGVRQQPAPRDPRPTVLWVGKSDRVKQPVKAVELARRFPDVLFRLVMNRSSASLFDRIVASKPDNVEIIERLPFDEAERLFPAADVLLNTSRFEGFPNTFLQAGKYGVPIASLGVDPDGFIAREGCGVVADGDMDRLAEGLGRLVGDKGFHAGCAANLSAYVARVHDLDQKVDTVLAAIGRLRE